MKKQYVAAFGLVLSASTLMAENTTHDFRALFEQQEGVATTPKSPIQGNIAPQQDADASGDERKKGKGSPFRSPREYDAQTPKKPTTSSVQTSSSWSAWAYNSAKGFVSFVARLIGF